MAAALLLIGDLQVSENKFRGPTFMYGPNGEAEVFRHSVDVPAGWTDAPQSPRAAEPEKRSDVVLTRQQVVAALQERGIVFQRNASTQSLHDKLVEVIGLTEA